jgi:hypothetical protein
VQAVVAAITTLHDVVMNAASFVERCVNYNTVVADVGGGAFGLVHLNLSLVAPPL